MIPIKQLIQRLKAKQPNQESKNQLDLIWKKYQSADKFGQAKLERYIRSYAAKFNLDPVDDAVILPPPTQDQARGTIPIGDVTYLDNPPYLFNLSNHELTRHMGIFGYTGTGKTTLARNIVTDLIKNKVPVLIIDWETSYRSLIREFPYMKIYTIGRDVNPYRFNFFKVPPGMAYQDYVKDVVGVFSRAYIGGAGVDNILRGIFDQAYQFNRMPTMDEVKAILSKETAPAQMRGRAMNWKQTAQRMIEFLCYGRTGVAFNTKSPEGIDPLIQGPVILELGGLGDDHDKQFTVQIILLWYWRLLEHQGIEHESLKHVILLEEFHRVADNPLIIDAFKMMRKYGTGIIALDQMPSQVPPEVFENMATKITFALQKDQNIRAIASSMYMDRDQTRFIGLLRKGQAIIRCAERYPYPFMITVPFHGNPATVPDDAIRTAQSHDSNLSSHNQPEHDWCPPLQGSPKSEYTPPTAAKILLQDIAQYPFDGTNDRYKRKGFTTRQGNDLKTALVAQGYLDPVRVDRKTLLALTAKARTYLQTQKIPIPTQARGGLEHNYWLDQIKTKYIQLEGFTFIEKDDIDLVVEHYDFTHCIQVETGKSDIQKNIITLTKSKGDRLFMIATSKQVEIKIKNLIAESKTPFKERIELFFVKDFLDSNPIS